MTHAQEGSLAFPTDINVQAVPTAQQDTLKHELYGVDDELQQFDERLRPKILRYLQAVSNLYGVTTKARNVAGLSRAELNLLRNNELFKDLEEEANETFFDEIVLRAINRNMHGTVKGETKSGELILDYHDSTFPTLMKLHPKLKGQDLEDGNITVNIRQFPEPTALPAQPTTDPQPTLNGGNHDESAKPF